MTTTTKCSQCLQPTDDGGFHLDTGELSCPTIPDAPEGNLSQQLLEWIEGELYTYNMSIGPGYADAYYERRDAKIEMLEEFRDEIRRRM